MSTTEPHEWATDEPSGHESSHDELSQDPGEIETEIARHREDLGATVDELTERLDVKKQAKNQIADLKTQAKSRAADLQAQGANRAQSLRRGFQRADHAELTALGARALAGVAAVGLLVVVVRRVRR
ncbi:DUF3618 domain-containing protein [Janibacter alittae]|uniref:DUF3618 domain-containing protein n=1 Tax=Janibacter alittae TaxID=3115209 RepID=A0ABZ2MG80_9MICO